MKTDDFTLNDFFSIADIHRNRLAELESQSALVSIKRDLLSRFKDLSWPAVWGVVTDHIEQLLDIRLADVMVRGWNTYRGLLKYRDKSKFPPNDTYLVPLAEHSIMSRHQPALVIRIDEAFHAEIPFEVVLTLKLSGIILHISDGRIRKIHSGNCKGSGTLKCMGLLLLEKQSSIIQLPGTVALGAGIPIGGSPNDQTLQAGSSS